MALIKRYPNRKLYHTEAKQYITLDEIAELIRAGDDVRVVDYATGDDLTTLTFTQIILEQEKQNAGFLPQSILASLVRAGGKTRRAVRRALVYSLGFWNQIDEEIKRRVELLVNRGELTAEEAIRFTKKLLSIQNIFEVDEVPSPDLREIEGMLVEIGVPTREEFNILLSKLDKLSEMIDEITR